MGAAGPVHLVLSALLDPPPARLLIGALVDPARETRQPARQALESISGYLEEKERWDVFEPRGCSDARSRG